MNTVKPDSSNLLCVRLGGPFVYAIVAESAVKIGIARNPFTRIRELQTGNPLDLRLVAIEDAGEDARYLEHYVHHALRAHRMRGEWFRLDDTVRTCVERFSRGEFIGDVVAQVLACA